mmetsp:Transcript_16811/g.34245  ORF Transcript_16811/g.34245 Transcript_16811/m.34245 type:complete len:95 (+) Transcript_16811:570-854(+)
MIWTTRLAALLVGWTSTTRKMIFVEILTFAVDSRSGLSLKQSYTSKASCGVKVLKEEPEKNGCRVKVLAFFWLIFAESKSQITHFLISQPQDGR